MPSFNKTIINDTTHRTLVAFNYQATSTQAISGLTGSVLSSELLGYQGFTSATATSLDISRVYWSIPNSTTGTSIEIAFGVSGSLTGNPVLSLNGSGVFDFMAAGNSIHDTFTGPTRSNTITLRNTGVVPINTGLSVVLELSKSYGFK